jgi:hypothetical protein
MRQILTADLWSGQVRARLCNHGYTISLVAYAGSRNPRSTVIMKFLGYMLVIGATAWGGCNQYGYRYQPHPQLEFNPIYADYCEQPEQLDILIDTHGRRLDSIEITKADGTVIAPVSIDYPPFKGERIGGDSDSYTAEISQGPTVAHFDKSAVGQGPWNVRVQLLGFDPVVIRVGPE